MFLEGEITILKKDLLVFKEMLDAPQYTKQYTYKQYTPDITLETMCRGGRSVIW